MCVGEGYLCIYICQEFITHSIYMFLVTFQLVIIFKKCTKLFEAFFLFYTIEKQLIILLYFMSFLSAICGD